MRRQDPPSSRPGVRARLTRSAEVEAGELERRHQDPPSSRPQSSSAAAEIRRVPQRRRAGRRKEGRISAEEEGPPLEEVPPAWGEVAGNGWLVRRGKKAVEGSRDKIFF